MGATQLDALRELLEEDLDGVTVTDGGLRAVLDTRWGEVTVHVDPDEAEKEDDAIALRIQVFIPPPAGSGQEFLVWCLATNVQYWGVSIGLQEDGMLVVHSDLEAPGTIELAQLAGEIVDRAESVQQLLDEDLADWCLEHRLGTPSQRKRWDEWKPKPLQDD